jgi:hypothetical protein
METFSADVKKMAPCGMNCSVCMAFQREKNKCSGCYHADCRCKNCKIKSCDLLAGTESGFCYECTKYPCIRLKHLDKRYRTKYHMSMIENLDSIRKLGLAGFLQIEDQRWLCSQCGGQICVHRGYCIKCHTS